MNRSTENQITFVFDGGGGGGGGGGASGNGSGNDNDNPDFNNDLIEGMLSMNLSQILLTDSLETLPHHSPDIVQASIILLICVLIIVSNAIIICSLSQLNSSKEILNYYLLSLSFADLLYGVVIVPFSVHAALVGDWIFGDLTCRLAGYFEISLWIVTIYTFMWISVDRYLLIRKPFRYDVLQTKIRTQCWIVLTWISALMLCSPPLLNFHKPIYNRDSFVCYLDWSDMIAYAITLAVLVLGPSLITILFCYSYILRVLKKLQNADPVIMHDKELASALSENLANPNHLMTTILIVVFWLAWMPFIVINSYEYFVRVRFQMPRVHFVIVWFGMLNSFWKFVILVLFSDRFRFAMQLFWIRVTCRTRARYRQRRACGQSDADIEFDDFSCSV